MLTTAIIVNYNAGELLAECVAALLAGETRPCVRVVDNASTDGSAERLKRLYAESKQVAIAFNPGNPGFGPAVNAVLDSVSTEFVLVLNPDCRVAPDTLRLLESALQDDPRAALAGPLVLDENGQPERASLRRFPDPWRSLMTVTGLARLGRRWQALDGVTLDPACAGGATLRAEAVSGACMLIRRAALAKVHGFDPAYTLHCEDLDLMFRLHQRGWHCLFVSGARAVHHQGESSRSRPLWVHRQKHLGMCRFFRKFQAAGHSLPIRWLVYTGIWLRYALLLPWVMLRR